MKRDVIVGKLIKEGFSINTLVKFNDKQLMELASRMISEEDVMISKKDPQFQQKVTSAKKLNKTIETYEQELIGGQKKLDKNHNGKIDGQDFKILKGQKKKNKDEAKPSKEKEVKEWVKNLAESNYHSFTSKNEIMELIGSKLNESDIQYGANVKKGHNGIPEFMSYDVIKGDNSPKIAPAKPKVDPGTKPKRQSPFQPGPGPNPKPKALKEDGDTKTAPAKPKVEPDTKPKRQSPFKPGPGPNPKPKA